MLICLPMLFFFSTGFGQNTERTTIDLNTAKMIIDSLDKQFSKHYYNCDSIALYAMYTKDASFGAAKGQEILQVLGRNIRSSMKNNTRTIIFTITSLSVDSEFIIEVGKYETKDDQGNSKGKGKYLVVWKQENGEWKLYRDIGL